MGYGPWGCKESDMTEQLHKLSKSLRSKNLKKQHKTKHEIAENKQDV